MIRSEYSDGADNLDTFDCEDEDKAQIAVTRGCLNLLQSPVENLPLNPVEAQWQAQQ